VSQVQLSKEERVGFKTPIMMGSVGAVVLMFFGILGREGDVVFEISRRTDTIQLPSVPVDSSTLGLVSGVLLLAISALATWLAMQNRKTPLWISAIYGLIGVTALLGWLAADNSVPIAFIAGTALVLAVPIMLGAMGGIMCERV